MSPTRQGAEPRPSGAVMSDLIVFTGSSNPRLAAEVVAELGITLGRANVGRFSDGEVSVEIEQNVRGKDVFVIQSTCAPTNDNLMELVIMADALRRASAYRVTAVVPYFGYARQDRRARSARVPISAKVVADMLGGAGINRLLTVDLHADQIQGFFKIPVDNVYASDVLVEEVTRQAYGSPVVVSPDVGGVVRARAVAKLINDLDLAIIDKRRPRPNHARVMNVIGEVQGRSAVLVDDMVDTANTLCAAAEALKAAGATWVAGYATHPVLSGDAVARIAASALDEVVVTDTIPLCEPARACGKIRQLSLGRVLAESIRRVSREESVSELFH